MSERNYTWALVVIMGVALPLALALEFSNPVYPTIIIVPLCGLIVFARPHFLVNEKPPKSTPAARLGLVVYLLLALAAALLGWAFTIHILMALGFGAVLGQTAIYLRWALLPYRRPRDPTEAVWYA